MNISRRSFLKSSLIAALGILAYGISAKTKLFADTAEKQEKIYKVGDKVPEAGRYQCVVCGFIVEYLPKHIEKGVTFNFCTVCKAGTEGGPKKPNEEFWRHIGACS